MSVLAFLSLGFSEMLVIGVVGLLVFGGRLPDVMQGLGRTYGKFRRGMNDLAHPIRQEMRNLDVTSPPPPSVPTGNDADATRQPPPLYTPSNDAIPAGGETSSPAIKPLARPPASHGGAADEPPPV